MKFFKLFFLIGAVGFAQNKDGAWDNIRTTNETFELKSGEKKLVASADFPVGTTEAVLRITILDDNQKLSGSLVSLLKAIPDPTGISQGAAGGVFLLSSISGEDKCKYSIFKSEADAQNYLKTAKKPNACFSQETPVNKEVKLLSSDSKCLVSGNRNLYFVFESDNWIMKEKVVLEIVPWVNAKLSSGWNPQTKKQLLALANGFEWTNKLLKKQQFLAGFIDNVTGTYTYAAFSQLLPAEKDKAVEQAAFESLKKSGETEKYFNAIRTRSLRLFQSGKTDEAIDLLNVEMLAKNRASYKDYGVLGDYHLLTKQFSKAENYYNEGLKRNPSEIQFRLNLAHVYLFTDRFSEAKAIHKQYAKENLSNGKSWLEQTKADFTDFDARGMTSKDFKKILRNIE